MAKTSLWAGVFILFQVGMLAKFGVGLMAGGVLGNALGFAIMAVWNLLVGLVCFALSKGMPHHCDMPVMKVRGA